MPELPFQRVKTTNEEGTNNGSVRQEIIDYGYEILGDGVTNIVVVDPRRPDKAIAVPTLSPMTPEMAKEWFYLHNIFNTVFPHNFPHIYLATGTGYEESSLHNGTIRQKIIEKATRPLIRRFQIRYPFSHVKRICKKLGVPLNFDDGRDNFMVGIDGGEYYVDRLSIPFLPSEKLRPFIPYMERKHYPKENIQRVQRYLNRLDQIQKGGPRI